MMNYEIFKEVVAEKFMDYLPEKYQGEILEVYSVDKVNQKLDGLTLRGMNGSNIAPTIYINTMYEEYLESENLGQVLIHAAETMDNVRKGMPERVSLDMESAKDNIVFQLINTEQNKDMLKDVPHREFQDLSIIYRWVVGTREDSIASSVIHNNLAKNLGLDERELFQLAVVNTRRIMPPQVMSMNDVIKEMFASDGMPQEIIDTMIEDMPKEQTMWVITNERKINGATAMLYEDELHKLAEDLETDLYILPSSVHEVIAVSTEMGEPGQLANMVNEINMSEVRLEDRLSNQVYFYDKDLRKLTLATDTPNKRLDGAVAEPQLLYDAGKSR